MGERGRGGEVPGSGTRVVPREGGTVQVLPLSRERESEVRDV